jgi:hypothetical protein
VKKDEAMGGAVLFFFGGLTTLLSLRMPIGTFRAAGAGLFPLLLGIILMVLSGLFLLSLLLQKENGLETRSPGDSPRRLNRYPFSGDDGSVTLFLFPGYPLIAFL